MEIVTGPLLDQNVEVIVNAWHRNLVPQWMSARKGVSKDIRAAAGRQPFVELRQQGVLPLGAAVWTSAGDLPHRGIIHVAGISHLWRASPRTVNASVKNACDLAVDHDVESLAFPLIGARSAGMNAQRCLDVMTETASEFALDVRIVLLGSDEALKPSPTP